MNIKRILCPVDFSAYSMAANIYASLFADAADAEIFYLAVNYPPSNEGRVKERLDALLERLSVEIRPLVRGVQHQFDVRDGNPAQQILNAAEERNIDLIVMGTHGTSGLERLIHGSICGKVLRLAKCPVMAVKDWREMPESKSSKTAILGNDFAT